MAELADPAGIREVVRAKYAAAAKGAAEDRASCCGGEVSLTDAAGAQVFGGALYSGGDAAGAPPALWAPRSAAVCRRRSPIFMRGRRCWTSAPVPAPTS